MKRVRYCLLLVFMYIVTNQLIPVFASTNVRIHTFTSNVCNLYYEIIRDQKRIDTDLEYLIINQDNEIIIESKTKEGLIIDYDLPFGEYTLIIDEVKLPLILDNNYLTTQHILKQIDISSSIQTNTSDVNQISIYVSLLSISFISLSLIKRKSPFTG